MELSLGRKLLYSAVAVASAFALLEGVARVVWPPTDDVYQEHRQLITVLGLPAINAAMTFDPVLFWKLVPDLDDHRVVGEIRGVPFDFAVSTDARGLRRGGGASGETEGLHVLALGDSCTFGLGVEDDEAWPALLEQLLAPRVAGGARVSNAGVPGYTSFQGLRYLEGPGLALEPDLVLVSFGFNDADVWSSRSDVETARWLAERARLRSWDALLHRSALYAGLARGLRGRAGPEVDVRLERPRVAPEEFLANLRAMRELTRLREIPTVFLIWPYRDQLQRNDPAPIVYQPLITQAGERSATPVLDLFEAFRRADEPFLDHVHASPAGTRAAAREIARFLLRSRQR